MNAGTIFEIVVVVLIIWVIYSRFTGIKGLRNLNAEQFESELQRNANTMVIDVREPGELNRGMIPGATNIPLSQLHSRVGEIPRDKSIYLYCQSGMRSKIAAKILMKKGGCTDLAHLRGGMSAWRGNVGKQ